MNTQELKHTAIPANSVVVGLKLNADQKSSAVTLQADYDAVKHLLVGKPLRRPNRTRALDEKR